MLHPSLQALLSDLLQLDARELRQRVILQRQQLNSSFLFWLSDLERKASGARKQQLSMLAAELVATREYLGAGGDTLPYVVCKPQVPLIHAASHTIADVGPWMSHTAS